MQFIQKTFLLFSFLVLTINGSAQNNAELGFRIAHAPYNRIQLEFRKPFNEKYALRLGASTGQDWGYPMESIFDANDSVVTTRQKNRSANYYDLRIGLNRTLGNSAFSLHADLIFGYNRDDLRNWNYYHAIDSTGTWNYTGNIEPGDKLTYPLGGLATARNHYLSSGLSLGISYDYPLTEKLILSLNFNQTGMLRFQFDHTENNDLFNEFDESNATIFDFCSSAGIGLRYKFGTKKTE